MGEDTSAAKRIGIIYVIGEALKRSGEIIPQDSVQIIGNEKIKYDKIPNNPMYS